MNESWKKEFDNSAMLFRTFTDLDGKEVLFEVALTDISTNPNVDLNGLAQNALKKRLREKAKKYRFTGSHFEPI